MGVQLYSPGGAHRRHAARPQPITRDALQHNSNTVPYGWFLQLYVSHCYYRCSCDATSQWLLTII